MLLVLFLHVRRQQIALIVDAVSNTFKASETASAIVVQRWTTLKNLTL